MLEYMKDFATFMIASTLTIAVILAIFWAWVGIFRSMFSATDADDLRMSFHEYRSAEFDKYKDLCERLRELEAKVKAAATDRR
jgi:hypothetical protein